MADTMMGGGAWVRLGGGQDLTLRGVPGAFLEVPGEAGTALSLVGESLGCPLAFHFHHIWGVDSPRSLTGWKL